MFVCKNCGNEFGKWSGVCPACKEWNSLVESSSKFGSSRASGQKIPARRVESIKLSNIKKIELGKRLVSSLTEFDRVVGGGLVAGGVVLFAGEPGIGKSTLVSQLSAELGALYIGGEESASQIGRRMERLGLKGEGVEVLETARIEEIVDFLERTQNVFNLVVVDSIQVMAAGEITGGAGSVTQIRECTLRLVEVAKRKSLAMIIVGHVTKEGDIAGPKMLEHMVDAVVYLEGDKTSDLRILRCYKNRFGPTDEVGVFRMVEGGMQQVRGDNLVTGEGGAVPGLALTLVMDGTRPMLLEVQALVVESFAPQPRRVFSGIAYDRGQLMAAVAQKILNIPLYKYDLYLQVTGGIKIVDPAADLAVVAAIYSSFKNRSLPKNGVFVGEVGLLGGVKKPKFWEKRVKEAGALGKKMAEMATVGELRKER